MLALCESGCPYLVIGGVAVVHHGSSRFTPDVNLLLDFDSDKLPLAFEKLAALGLNGSQETNIHELASENKRAELLQASGPLFDLGGMHIPNFSVDLMLLDLPEKDRYFRNKHELNSFGECIPIISRSDLIEMKKKVNRPQDQMDIEQLELIAKLEKFSEVEEAFEALQSDLPEGMDRNYLESVMEFQNLTADQRFEWLVNMLAAVGGFCMF